MPFFTANIFYIKYAATSIHSQIRKKQGVFVISNHLYLQQK